MRIIERKRSEGMMAEGVFPNKLDKETFDKVYQCNPNSFTSWVINVPPKGGTGILCGFAEVWAFYWDYINDHFNAEKIINASGNADRGFSFVYNKNANTITITTSNTVWSGAFVILTM